jgi:hypothetical protein
MGKSIAQHDKKSVKGGGQQSADLLVKVRVLLLLELEGARLVLVDVSDDWEHPGI